MAKEQHENTHTERKSGHSKILLLYEKTLYAGFVKSLLSFVAAKTEALTYLFPLVAQLHAAHSLHMFSNSASALCI